ncbi:MAG TPA: class I SAM-dependent methyltransferase [Gaiellaceae bacterium]|nr:class I SAM-dependent methyltransferase [Gaiellaceae bacterium]
MFSRRRIAPAEVPGDLYYKESRGRSWKARLDEVRRMADLRPGDSVIDVGCAEGLITLELAKLVDRIHGIDVHDVRIAEAKRLAAERGVQNATFELASVIDYPFEPLSYDVSLFMAVWGKPAEGIADRSVGAGELRAILGATRRQHVMRVTVQYRRKTEPLLEQLLRICDESGFDALCFSRPMAKKGKPGSSSANMLIANRRGTDARIGEVPPLALVPTALLADHPVVQSARAAPAGGESAVTRA